MLLPRPIPSFSGCNIENLGMGQGYILIPMHSYSMSHAPKTKSSCLQVLASSSSTCSSGGVHSGWVMVSFVYTGVATSCLSSMDLWPKVVTENPSRQPNSWTAANTQGKLSPTRKHSWVCTGPAMHTCPGPQNQ